MSELDNCRRLYEHLSSLKLIDNNSFQQWFNTTVLYLFILKKLISIHDSEITKSFHQELLNHFYLDLEIKLNEFGLKTNIQKVLQDLISSYQGQILAYDEGLYYGDGVLLASLWRNLFLQQDASFQEMVRVLEYFKSELERGQGVELESILNSTFTFNKYTLK